MKVGLGGGDHDCIWMDHAKFMFSGYGFFQLRLFHAEFRGGTKKLPQRPPPKLFREVEPGLLELELLGLKSTASRNSKGQGLPSIQWSWASLTVDRRPFHMQFVLPCKCQTPTPARTP